jgi:hypothetical protein
LFGGFPALYLPYFIKMWLQPYPIKHIPRKVKLCESFIAEPCLIKSFKHWAHNGYPSEKFHDISHYIHTLSVLMHRANIGKFTIFYRNIAY